MKKSSFLSIIAMVSLLSTMALADVVPTQMNFQGVLSDTGGNPISDSTKSVQFTIYDAGSGGNVLWAETLNVTTDNQGRFTIVLGQVWPVYGTVFNDTSRYMGVKVGSDPEISPRAKISSSAYSLRTRSINGAIGGTLVGGNPGEGAVLFMDNGSGENGAILWGNGSGEGGSLFLSDETGYPTAAIEPDGSGSGGSITIFEDNAIPTHFLEPDVDNAGGFMGIFSDASALFSGMYFDGNTEGSGDPSLIILGTGNSATFDMRYTGDATVTLPNSAISKTEIDDEPGIAANSSGGNITLNTSNMVDLVTVSINIPAAGYVVVEGKCYAQIASSAGSFSAAGGYFQIDQTPGGGELSPYYTLAAVSQWPDGLGVAMPVYVTRIYYFPSPGTQTFRLEGKAFNTGDGATTYGTRPMLTASYFPSAYGSVVTAVSANEASQFEQALPITPQEYTGLTVSVPSDQMFQVDLRELELKALKEKAEAEKAQRELVEAQLKLQLEKSNSAHRRRE